jgi:hypothetical protein
MEKEKIYELKIDEFDEVSGVDAISLVDEPAINIGWVAFKKTQEDFHIPDGEDQKYIDMLLSKAEDEDEMLDQGWEIDRIEDARESFTLNPNKPSEEDDEVIRVRYKYGLNPNIQQNKIISTTRDFCRSLLNKNYVWRAEDIDSLTNDFGQSAQVWRGGYNCRHQWFKIFYKAKGSIINKASVNVGKILDAGMGIELSPDWIQPNTVTNKTMDNPSPSTIRNLGLSKQDFESYSDYPDSVKHNAQRVLDWVEKNGWGSCGTPVGKQRANQLAKGESISLDTVKRMYSYLSRHEKDLDSSKGYGDGCGKLMYDSWGGKSALSWAESKIKKAEKMSKQEMGYDNSLPKFIDPDIKKKPIHPSLAMKIQMDDVKRRVTGPAMVPDMKIFRKDDLGNPYYVYFSAPTIQMIADKYFKNKFIDNNDMMHDGKALPDVYVVESWIKESNNDKSTDFGYGDTPVGTWFVTMQVNNEKVWNDIKAGKLTGFSVSGYFEEISKFIKEELFLQKVAEILKEF